ncbi:MAG: Ltp family lipoprotein [Eubacteriaceae bacterium]|jgi:hypothetical protein|nr:Ltp family lipoprotein [Eubacteriaceae bacterium]
MKSKEEKLQLKLANEQAKKQKKAIQGSKPVYKKWWFYVIIVFAIIVIAGIAGSGSSSDTSSPDSGSSTTTSESSSTNSSDSNSDSSESEMTTAQENAYQSAQDYISSMPFSRRGLVDQLSSDAGEGYDREDAVYAVNLLEKNGEVNWKEQAYLSAKSYLESGSFSLNGLIDQLESSAGEKFTHKQAVYGAKKAYNE